MKYRIHADWHIASRRPLSRGTSSRGIINLAASGTIKRPHEGKNDSHLSSHFLWDQKKNHSAGENTVGTHRALRNMDKAIEPRFVSFQFPGAPSSMGSNPSPLPRPPPAGRTTLHLRRHSNLFSAAGWHALRRNSLSQDALASIPYIFPFRYSVPLSSCPLSSPDI